MVAMPLFDLIVASTWVAGLTIVLLAQSVNSWMKYRHAARYARHAARLSAATRPEDGRTPAAAGAAGGVRSRPPVPGIPKRLGSEALLPTGALTPKD